MRAAVIYESMYGNTRTIAEAIAAGLAPTMQVRVLSVAQLAGGVDEEALRSLDLLVLGAPTHAWGMSRPSTRRSAVEAAAKPGSALVVQPGADGPGLREWLDTMRCTATRVATFDTHMAAPAGLSGSAARRIARRVRRLGFEPAAPPEQFLVTKQNRLAEGESQRAADWGRALAARSQPVGAPPRPGTSRGAEPPG